MGCTTGAPDWHQAKLGEPDRAANCIPFFLTARMRGITSSASFHSNRPSRPPNPPPKPTHGQTSDEEAGDRFPLALLGKAPHPIRSFQQKWPSPRWPLPSAHNCITCCFFVGSLSRLSAPPSVFFSILIRPRISHPDGIDLYISLSRPGPTSRPQPYHMY